MIKQRVTAQKGNRIFCASKRLDGGGGLRCEQERRQRYYNLLRGAILGESIRETKREVGEYELDELCSTTTSTTACRWKLCCKCHSENEFARGKSHVNGIENFWSFAKRRLVKFNGCNSAAFMLHLKERD